MSAALPAGKYGGGRTSRGCGGIGRRDGLKIRFWRQSVGSSPTTRTNASHSRTTRPGEPARVFRRRRAPALLPR